MGGSARRRRRRWSGWLRWGQGGRGEDLDGRLQAVLAEDAVNPRHVELALSEPAARPRLAAHRDGSLGAPLGDGAQNLALQTLKSVACQLSTLPTMGDYDSQVAAL